METTPYCPAPTTSPTRILRWLSDPQTAMTQLTWSIGFHKARVQEQGSSDPLREDTEAMISAELRNFINKERETFFNKTCMSVCSSVHV